MYKFTNKRIDRGIQNQILIVINKNKLTTVYQEPRTKHVFKELTQC